MILALAKDSIAQLHKLNRIPGFPRVTDQRCGEAMDTDIQMYLCVLNINTWIANVLNNKSTLSHNHILCTPISSPSLPTC